MVDDDKVVDAGEDKRTTMAAEAIWLLLTDAGCDPLLVQARLVDLIQQGRLAVPPPPQSGGLMTAEELGEDRSEEVAVLQRGFCDALAPLVANPNFLAVDVQFVWRLGEHTITCGRVTTGTDPEAKGRLREMHRRMADGPDKIVGHYDVSAARH